HLDQKKRSCLRIVPIKSTKNFVRIRWRRSIKGAQGRVWTGEDAASHGLVDAISGFSRAVVK
ncbi:hypothetical protein Tco_1398614, partial [Tanacetum coccineum]